MSAKVTNKILNFAILTHAAYKALPPAEIIQDCVYYMSDEPIQYLNGVQHGYSKEDFLKRLQTLSNVTVLTGTTYQTPAAAATALAALYPDYVPAESGKISFKDSFGVWHEFVFLSGVWEEVGSFAHVDYAALSTTPNYLNNLGKAVFNASYRATPFISLHDLDNLLFKGRVAANISYIAFYDADYAYIAQGSKVGTATEDKEELISAADVPAGALYVRFCALTATTSVFEVNTQRAPQHNYEQVEKLSQRVDELEANTSSRGVGSWDDSLDPDMDEFVGDLVVAKDISRKWLVNGTTGEVIGELQKKCDFKFVDGSYAPVVVVPDTVAAEDMQPWETHDLGYDILIGAPYPYYMLEAEIEGKTVKGFFKNKVLYKGIEPELVDMTFTVDSLPTEKGGKLRNIAMHVDTAMNPAGAGSLVNYFTSAVSGWAYPKNNVSQNSTQTLARAKNAEGKTAFVELMAFHRLAHVNAAFLINKTYNLHATTLFGGGISSDYGVNADSWLKVSGCRCQIGDEVGTTTWRYGTFGAQIPFGYNSGGSTTNYSEFLSAYRGKEGTRESQTVLSYAFLNNIQPGVEFSYKTSLLGGASGVHENVTYWYEEVEGHSFFDVDDAFNVRLYKKVTLDFNGYVSGAATPVRLEIVLQTGVVEGQIMWGDMWEFCWNGLECIVHKDGTPTTATTGYPQDIYLCTHQKDLVVDATVYKAESEQFACESVYKKIATTIRTNDSWTSKFIPYTIVRKGVEGRGGSLNSGQCAYTYESDYLGGSTGQKVRAYCMGRVGASSTDDSARSRLARSTVSIAYVYLAPAYQVAPLF